MQEGEEVETPTKSGMEIEVGEENPFTQEKVPAPKRTP